ncbi:sensor histidine kinase [Patescibacteria group bacterium]
MKDTKEKVNIFREYKNLGIKFWQYPHVLFGIYVVFLAVCLYVVAPMVVEKQLPAILFVGSLLIIFLYLVGYIITFTFNRIVNDDRIKSEFVSIASHQLKTPLVNSQWTIDALKQEIKDNKTPRSLDESLSGLHLINKKMLFIIESFLDLTSIESRRLVFDKEEFSLVSVTQKETDSFFNTAKQKSVVLDFSNSTNLPNVSGDIKQTSMVIQNLVDNAIKYTPTGERVTIRIKKENDSFLHWEISHPGPGIPKENQKYIFKKFYHAYTKKTGDETKKKGFGIGLYIAKEIVSMSGGKIGFNTKKGEGATFWFTLPINKN